jgi:hypothetical protein
MTARYTPIHTLPDALRNWTGKPLNSLPADMAPAGYLAGAAEENRVLADTFMRLCAMSTTSERMTFLLGTIEMHKRHVRIAESTIRGERNPRLVGSNASREAWSQLRPIEDMIEVMEQWRDELLDGWSAEVGVELIDQAARRSA